MQFPKEFSASDFLEAYWQRKALFIVGGLPQGLPVLSPDELAWLATLDDVESRLIFTQRSGTNCEYTVRQGPFSSDELVSLPETDWTLLVHDVDKHLPDFRCWFDCADFIPDWRIDDLMVSFAAPGGSAGPHRDNYDVFLCQGQGHRHWQIAAANARVISARSAGLELLEPFPPESEHAAATSDVLYLPPGVPHWGLAQDRCMTYSIGMRAPDHDDILRSIERIIPDAAADIAPDPDNQTAGRVFRDPDRAMGECQPGQISDPDLSRVRRAFPSLRRLVSV